MDRGHEKVTVPSLHAAIRAEEARKKRRQKKEDAEAARRRAEEKEDEENSFWINLYSMDTADGRDKEAAKLIKSRNNLKTPRRMKEEEEAGMDPLPVPRLWRLNQTPQRFRSLLWAAEHLFKDIQVRKRWDDIAHWLDLEEDEYQDLWSAYESDDEKFYKVIERWEARTANPDLRRLVVILEGLGIHKQAEMLKERKFEHLMSQGKKTTRKGQKTEETEASFWKRVYKLPLAVDRDKEVGNWWPYHVEERKTYVKEKHQAENDNEPRAPADEGAETYRYEEKLVPIPKHHIGPDTKVTKWRRRVSETSGTAAPASRLMRLGMTPRQYRSILWAAEHVTGHRGIRMKWQRIAVALGLKVADFDHLRSQEVSADERFYQVIQLRCNKRKLHIDEFSKALGSLGMEDLVEYFDKPKFMHLIHPNKSLGTVWDATVDAEYIWRPAAGGQQKKKKKKGDKTTGARKSESQSKSAESIKTEIEADEEEQK